ncbi:DNA methyltransferase [Pseudarthrobacter sp. H3Y2-7]|uniref:site-specific DNA-methyltransferase n=1 Tax=Pseudarthrobacter naphthalenicus TaxID=3031328 RepID=UPI0023AF3354|nr:DNA methyltransferase [Pseudarthrobacter sp. H3Y2-7]MDE8670633.1 DNA methyltransferase [Pseudarthrobacter sp. H3Y2-7]
MSRLTDLLRAAKQLDPQLGKDLEDEIQPLQKRLPFGLNFERHAPEAVELAGHGIRKGSKVRVLSPRGSTARGDQRVWRVDKVIGDAAEISLLDSSEGEACTVQVDDLILVAEFRDWIYPGLRPDGAVERGGDKPFHTVINGENFHVLEQLTFTHARSVDAIYIDPPYNTGARDWKYNNDYVEGDDLYRHSKWLAFMERRLKLAGRLLKPENSVLIVTIDEKEYLRLGLLLEQVFPEARIQMISIVINQNGSARAGELTRVNEFAYMCFFGEAAPVASIRQFRATGTAGEELGPVRWERLQRGANGALRSDRPNLFYPVFIDPTRGCIVEVGDPLGPDEDRSVVADREGLATVWPLSSTGVEKRWQVSHETLRRLVTDGLAKVGSYSKKNDRWSLSYLNRGQIERWQRGEFVEIGRDSNGVVELEARTAHLRAAPTSWDKQAHSAGEYGSRLLGRMLPGRKFPFPKSLYAVEDCLAIAIGNKRNAVVLDFFAGSGTTAHAVMRLNRQDDGRRQCISVTNNEVSAEEQTRLRKQQLRPGDAQWEQHGICDYITKPRIRSAITGRTPEGDPVKGDYKFVDEFPMADGFEENAAFFTLTYESPWRVSTDRAYAAIAPMLWLRAGARGRIIDDLSKGWAVAEAYGVIKDLDLSTDFIAALQLEEDVRVAFIVTDDEGRYQQIANEVPGIETVRLYEDYLRNCESNGDF